MICVFNSKDTTNGRSPEEARSGAGDDGGVCGEGQQAQWEEERAAADEGPEAARAKNNSIGGTCLYEATVCSLRRW